MGPFQKQLVLGDGRTLYEHAKDPSPGNPLDCSMLDMGEAAPPPQQVSVEEFEATMKRLRGGA